MIDLHTHTNFSDGTDSPAQLINKALAAGISVIGLTDHDSVSGWQEATAALRPGISLVPGAEISCQTLDGISVHILGLLFDSQNVELMKTMEETRMNRHGRMAKIIARINEAGIDITMDDVLEQLADGATLGRPHLADALVKKGVVASRDEAFTQMLHNKSKYYVSHYSPTPEVAIKLIKDAGGVSVIAHPMASHRGRTISSETFGSLIKAGLDGIEVDHRDHSPEEKNQLIELARDNNLVMTGASDYHGNGKLNLLGEYTTLPHEWERLEAKANKRRVVKV
ncbi:MAG: PHP domain-containing protein [Actinobacteria bacterium]|jgi:predicted metal-dependent phosphoesterase TrpH|nr:PHP domain-containing protein [Actinomycetota bacterium]NCZ80958.1 PHP domain-containing protein [Actinomycetota bacterium]NDA88686.1 PHP domain-containing protein [Actinomycetota bacterium]NDI08710.1 PHP domain-containing protein [Actinomycetota bacterium]NDI11272.1 PHP domain-containing protein [Actinomycetota bacterium]